MVTEPSSDTEREEDEVDSDDSYMNEMVQDCGRSLEGNYSCERIEGNDYEKYNENCFNQYIEHLDNNLYGNKHPTQQYQQRFINYSI